MNQHTSLLGRMTHVLWVIFLNGLLTILPLILTIALFRIFWRFAEVWLLEPVREIIAKTFIDDIPYSEIVITIGVIFLIGTIMRIFLLRSIVHAFEELLFKIPLIRTVYSGIKQLVHALGSQDKISFKKVVLVEFPRKGMYSIGFMTSEMPPAIAPDTHTRYYNIFIPTTPNPTTGFFIVLPEAEVNIMNITRQEAMAMVISGGIIMPDSYKNN